VFICESREHRADPARLLRPNQPLSSCFLDLIEGMTHLSLLLFGPHFLDRVACRYDGRL
jgi:hypothetical protein